MESSIAGGNASAASNFRCNMYLTPELVEKILESNTSLKRRLELHRIHRAKLRRCVKKMFKEYEATRSNCNNLELRRVKYAEEQGRELWDLQKLDVLFRSLEEKFVELVRNPSSDPLYKREMQVEERMKARDMELNLDIPRLSEEIQKLKNWKKSLENDLEEINKHIQKTKEEIRRNEVSWL